MYICINKYKHLNISHRIHRNAKFLDFDVLLYLQIRYYEQPGTKVCAAFLANNNTEAAETIKFKGKEHVIPPRSISILPDCKTVVYSTAEVMINRNCCCESSCSLKKENES